MKQTDEHHQIDEWAIEREHLPDPADGLRLERITYTSQGLRVKGYLVAGADGAARPPLVYCRGGIRGVGMVRVPRLVTLARRGFTVFAPFYRGNEGGEGREDFGGEDRHDLYAAVQLVRALPEALPIAPALIGFSRGALMALLAARECPGVGPVVVWGGVSDLRLTYDERVDLRRMLKRVVGHPRKDSGEYERRSPVCWADEIRTPVLIIHGSADEHVSVLHAYRLAEAFDAVGKPYTMSIYEGRPHVMSREEDERVLDYVFDWIARQK
ncbi:MAG: prolyl oligopeptidase [Paenibacillus sp.]|jgi:dipeptidyl aminopeptidase/acylaminoacyl peptidase|nr:prolyl oligopeptidase [Paenibacillus sp.]